MAFTPNRLQSSEPMLVARGLILDGTGAHLTASKLLLAERSEDCNVGAGKWECPGGQVENTYNDSGEIIGYDNLVTRLQIELEQEVHTHAVLLKEPLGHHLTIFPDTGRARITSFFLGRIVAGCVAKPDGREASRLGWFQRDEALDTLPLTDATEYILRKL